MIFFRCEKTFCAVAILATACMLSACAGRKNLAADALYELQSPSQFEIAQADALVGQLVKENYFQLVENSLHTPRIRRVAARLFKAAGAESLHYRFYTARAGQEANAFTVDNAAIIIYEPLLERLKSDDQLAAILGHELGHLILDGPIGGSEVAAPLNLGMGESDLAWPLLAESISMVPNSQSLLGSNAGESEELEMRADRIGLEIMKRAGYDPAAAIEIWSRAAEIFGNEHQVETSGTHPPFQVRLSSLKKEVTMLAGGN